jgi:hypothetical protein
MSLNLKNKGINLNSYSLIFGFFISVGLIFIALSFPMMKLRFDIWQHIDHINAYVLEPNANVTSRAIWLKMWAHLFRFLSIENIFTYAIVIHRVQFVLNCVAIYFAAKQIFSALLVFNEHEAVKNQWLSSLALSSVVVWLTIIGTFSFFQQAWIMWYSVNYQITLPMLFLALGLTVNAIAVTQNTQVVVAKALIAFVLVLGIYFFHAGELVYLLIYILIGILCFAFKIKINWKYVLIGASFLGIVLYLLIQMYSDHVPAIITMLKNGEYAQILTAIQAKGKWNALDGGNRFSANWNELYRFSVFAFVPICIFAWLNPLQVNKRVLWFIGFSLVFCFIPTFQYSAGLASLISYDGIVNRYYFASLIFLIIPLSAYFIIINFKSIRYPIGVICLTFLIMLMVLFYSKKINNEGVYFKNVQSIVKSIKAKKIDVGVSDAFILSTGLQIDVAETKHASNSFNYCGSFESLFIARYVYGKKNMLFDRLGNFSNTECENHARDFGKKIVYLN